MLGRPNWVDCRPGAALVQRGIQAESGDHGDRTALLEVGAPGDDHVRAVRHHDQRSSWTPALDDTQHLPGPVGQGLVWMAAFFVVSL